MLGKLHDQEETLCICKTSEGPSRLSVRIYKMGSQSDPKVVARIQRNDECKGVGGQKGHDIYHGYFHTDNSAYIYYYSYVVITVKLVVIVVIIIASI